MTRRFVVITTLLVLLGLGSMSAGLLCAQPGWPYPMVGTTSDTQRNALRDLRSRVDWLRDCTRTAPAAVRGGADLLRERFQELRGTYGSFRATLTADQSSRGASGLAELEEGLGILQEAFDVYEDDLAGGQPEPRALSNLCRALDEGVAVWMQQLNKVTSRIRIGW
jgi:hypothetical protein